MRISNRDYRNDTRPRSARRYEEQKVLSSEKNLALSYVKRASTFISPQLLRELSQQRQVSDREKKLCLTFADLLLLVNKNKLMNLDGWNGFTAFAQREERVQELLDSYLVLLEEGDVSSLLLEQVRQAYRECSGQRSETFGILQEFVCESLCYLEVRTELSKDAATTTVGTDEKLRPRSTNPSPSPWKSDIHADDRYVPIEIIDEYTVEEEHQHPARKACLIRPIEELKQEQQQEIPRVVVTQSESPEKRLPQAPPHAEAIRPAPQTQDEKPTLEYMEGSENTTNIIIKDVFLKPPRKTRTVRGSPAKSSPGRKKAAPEGAAGEAVNKIWEALKEAKRQSPQKKQPRESPTKRLREMKNTSLKNKQHLKSQGENLEGKMLYTVGPNAGYLVNKAYDASIPMKDLIKKDHVEAHKIGEYLLAKLGRIRGEEQKEGEDEGNATVEDFSKLLTP